VKVEKIATEERITIYTNPVQTKKEYALNGTILSSQRKMSKMKDYLRTSP
jgi:hypothetical protein